AKNITPKRQVARSKLCSGKGSLCASACRVTRFASFLCRARSAATSSNSELWSTATTEPSGPTRCARLMAGSPVPLARSSTTMPSIGCEYSTSASVTTPPMAADFAFQFSAAIKRYCEPHRAALDGDISGLRLPRLARSGGFGSRRPRLFRLGQQFRRFHPLRRFPEPFQIVELARLLGENVDDKIHVIEQYPFRLLVALLVRDAQAHLFEALIYRVGNGLNLPRVGSAAHDKVVGERTRALLQFENGELFGLLFLASENGFVDLMFEVGLCSHKVSRSIVTRGAWRVQSSRRKLERSEVRGQIAEVKSHGPQIHAASKPLTL